VMVVQERDRSQQNLVRLPLPCNHVIANQVPDELRAVAVVALGKLLLQPVEQRLLF
jgi:hypothetical protein